MQLYEVHGSRDWKGSAVFLIHSAAHSGYWTPTYKWLREYGVGKLPKEDIRHWVEEMVLQWLIRGFGL